MTSLKILAGLALLVFGLFVIVGEQLAGASADAFINARTTTAFAPIAGKVDLVDRPLGARISAGDPLGSINDLLVDSVRLADLVRERTDLEAEARRNDQQQSTLADQINDLQRRSSAYAKERQRQLSSTLDAAQAANAAARAELKYAQLALERSFSLRQRGIETGVSLENAQSLVEVSQRKVEETDALEKAAEISLRAAERGTYLGDGYNDAPYSQQRISELRFEQNRLSAESVALQAQLQSLDLRIATERQRVNRAGSVPLNSNVDGILWDYLSASGETVQRGADLVRLVDCDSTIVTLSVSESVYNRIHLGDPVDFRLNGEPTILEGTITRLAGSGASTLYDNLAVAPSQDHLQRFDVTLDVPRLRNDPELRCLIGRTGRVFFDVRPMDWLRQLWS
jgi:multidrug resistance efflux pump